MKDERTPLSRFYFFCASCHYCHYFVRLDRYWMNAFLRNNICRLQKLKPIERLFKFLQATFNLANEFRVGTASRSLSVMSANRSSRSQNLIAYDFCHGRFGKIAVEFNYSERKFPRSGFQVNRFLSLRIHATSP